jgi:hypothetical protein
MFTKKTMISFSLMLIFLILMLSVLKFGIESDLRKERIAYQGWIKITNLKEVSFEEWHNLRRLDALPGMYEKQADKEGR